MEVVSTLGSEKVRVEGRRRREDVEDGRRREEVEDEMCVERRR